MAPSSRRLRTVMDQEFLAPRHSLFDVVGVSVPMLLGAETSLASQLLSTVLG